MMTTKTISSKAGPRAFGADTRLVPLWKRMYWFLSNFRQTFAAGYQWPRPLPPWNVNLLILKLPFAEKISKGPKRVALSPTS